MPRTFDPWIGPHYESEGLDGLRLFVLAESHYGPHEAEGAALTRRVVESQGRGKRYRLFTTTAKMALGRWGGDRITDTERAAFWDRVVFANYIQSLVDDSAHRRTRPTDEMWEQAQEPFLQTVREVRPHAVLVLGLDVRSHLPKLPAGVVVDGIQHPSMYPKYAESQPIVQKLISDARESAGLPDRR